MQGYADQIVSGTWHDLNMMNSTGIGSTDASDRCIIDVRLPVTNGIWRVMSLVKSDPMIQNPGYAVSA